MPIERLCCLLLGASIALRLSITGVNGTVDAVYGLAGALLLAASLISLKSLKSKKDPVCAESLEP